MPNTKRFINTFVAAGLIALVGAGCTGKAKKAGHQRKADSYYAEGKLDAAEIECIKVLRIDPTDAQAIQRLGLIYADQGRSFAAAPFLTKASGMDTNNLEVRLKLVQVLGSLGFPKEARDQASYVFDRSPTNQEAMFLLASWSVNTNEVVQSRQRLQTTIQQSGETAGALASLALLSLKLGDTTNAEAGFKRAVSLDPKHVDAHWGLALVHLRQNDTNRAEAEFRAASSLAPLRSLYRLSYARFKYEAGGTNNWIQTSNEVRNVLAQVPDYMPALRLMAENDYAQRNFEACSATLAKVLARDPDDYDGLMLEGKLRRAQTNAAQAIVVFSKLTETYPDQPGPYLLLGDSQAANNQLDKAVESLRRAIRAADFRIYCQITNRFSSNELAKAGNVTDRLRAFDPVYADATVLLARAETRRGNPRVAIDSLTKLLQLFDQTSGTNANVRDALAPKAVDCYCRLAEAHLAQAAQEPALQIFDLWAKAIPGDPRPYYEAGLLQFDKGLLAEARRSFTKAEQMATNETWKATWKILKLDSDARKSLQLESGARLSQLDIKANRAPDALNRLEELKELSNANTNDIGLMLLTAKAYLQNRETNHAVAELTGVINSNTNVMAAYDLLARIYLEQLNTNQAIATLAEAIKNNPKVRGGYNLLASIYQSSGQPDKAVEEYKKITEINTNDFEAALRISRILEKQGRQNYPEALKYYEKVIALNKVYENNRVFPGFYAFALNQAAYLRLELEPNLWVETSPNLDRAYDYAQKAREVKPQDPTMADTLGWLMLLRGGSQNRPRALALLQESAGQLKSDPEVHYHLGMANYLLLQEQQARAAFQRALQITNSFASKADLQKRLAVLDVDVRTHNPTNLAVLEKRKAEVKDDPMALFRLAQLHESGGSYEKARENYSEALRLSPNSTVINVALAQLCNDRLKEPGKALEFAKTARSLAPDDPAVAYTLGRIAAQSSDKAWAVGLLQEAARKMPDNPEVCYDLGLTLYDVGRVSEAESSVRKARQLNPAFSRAAEAREFLTMIGLCNNPGQLLGAAAQVQQVANQYTNLTPALFAYALLLEKRSDTNMASKAYEGIYAKNPAFTPATRQLFLLLARSEANDNRANELGLKAREAFPQDAEVAKALGILAYRRKDFSRAAQLLDESKGQRPTDAELFFYLGMAQFQNQQTNQGTVSLRKFKDLAPNNPMVKQADQFLSKPKP